MAQLAGGHLLTHPDYDRAALTAFLTDLRQEFGVDVHLELGTSIAFDAGILVGEVLDVTENDGAIAILDVSATAHMPDVIEAPYRPALLGEGGVHQVRLGGPSCLAGDMIGTYAFDAVPQAGQRVAFWTKRIIQWSKPRRLTAFNCPLWQFGTARPTPCALLSNLIIPILKGGCHEAESISGRGIKRGGNVMQTARFEVVPCGLEATVSYAPARQTVRRRLLPPAISLSVWWRTRALRARHIHP